MHDQHAVRGFWGNVIVRDTAQPGILAISHLDAAAAQGSRVAIDLQATFGTQGLVATAHIAPQHPTKTTSASVLGEPPQFRIAQTPPPLNVLADI